MLEFLTITGYDEQASIDRMVDLSSRYPLEWGVLFSQRRQGVSHRYPVVTDLHPLYEARQKHGLRLSAHLCGKYSQDIMLGEKLPLSFPIEEFDRCQINHRHPNPELMKNAIPNIPLIAQWRDSETFADVDSGIEWLFDLSGGRGIYQTEWPENRHGLPRVGYSGGITLAGARHTRDVVTEKAHGPFWLDIESGARTDDDWLDLNTVENICAMLFD